MMLKRPVRRLGRDDFSTARRPIIHPASHFTILMLDVVAVAAVKGLIADIVLAKFLAKQPNGVVHGQTDPFQKESKLESSVMLQMVILSQMIVHVSSA